MDFETFDKLCVEIDRQCNEMRDTKGKEYAHEEDRFANFKRNAIALGLDPKQVLYVYAAKHWDSITSFVKTGRTFSSEPIQGRIKDLIVYMKLLWGIVEEDEANSNGRHS